MTDSTYFFNSYAFIEMYKNNPSYLPYRQAGIVTTAVNLFEVFYYFLKESQVLFAHSFLARFREYAVDFNTDLVAPAALFKYKHRKEKLAMVDCVGYTLSQELGIKFLTGDMQFRNKENVEFVQ